MNLSRISATTIALTALLAISCSQKESNVITPSDVKNWPFNEKVKEVEIKCKDGVPAYAEINGADYALSGKFKNLKRDAEFLNWDTGLFKQHSDPALANAGMFALLDDFNDYAEKLCNRS